MDTESSPIPDIPDKLYFRIGEVSKLLDVEPYVVRFWETEFPGLSPKKSDTGQRLFRRKDLELLLKIKHLLYERKFTIEGARQALVKAPKTVAVVSVEQPSLFGLDPLPAIKEELKSLLELLK